MKETINKTNGMVLEMIEQITKENNNALLNNETQTIFQKQIYKYKVTLISFCSLWKGIILTSLNELINFKGWK